MADEQPEQVIAPVETVLVEDVEPESVEDALRIVIRKSLEVNGLIRGLSEVARSLDRRSAHLCILADDCEDASYKKLVNALCKQNNIDIVTVKERSKLAEWAGLAKFDAEGNVKKVHKCSSVSIRDFGERTKALDMLLSQLQ
jgi:small subunit ribosomal protein S12e